LDPTTSKLQNPTLDQPQRQTYQKPAKRVDETR
jgi:hypothetical protein